MVCSVIWFLSILAFLLKKYFHHPQQLGFSFGTGESLEFAKFLYRRCLIFLAIIHTFYFLNKIMGRRSTRNLHKLLNEPYLVVFSLYVLTSKSIFYIYNVWFDSIFTLKVVQIALYHVCI